MTKIDHSFLGLSSPVLFPGVREPSGASCVGLSFDLGFHPILVANARVDWLAMDDDDITKKFPILLKGILQDVYSP